MDWLISLEDWQELIFSKPATPPYVLIIIGLLISLSSGLAFVASLRTELKLWFRNLMSKKLPRWGSLQLVIPFSGVAAGLCIFLAAILMTMGLPTLVSCITGLLLTILITYLFWLEIGRRIGNRGIKFYLAQQS